MNIEEIKLHLEYIKEKVDDINKDNKIAHKDIFDRMGIIEVTLAKLQVKSGFIGAIAGVIPASIVAIYFYIRSLPK